MMVREAPVSAVSLMREDAAETGGFALVYGCGKWMCVWMERNISVRSHLTVNGISAVLY